MPDIRRIFGDKGEDLAAKTLRKKGMKILERQYKTRIGEIDLIARDRDEIVFVEVKARRSRAFGYPEEAVTNIKIEKIYRVGMQYLKEKKLIDSPWRIDVVAILFKDQEPEIEHISNVSF